MTTLFTSEELKKMAATFDNASYKKLTKEELKKIVLEYKAKKE